MISDGYCQSAGHAFVYASLRSEDEILEYYNDPEEIHEEYGKRVDVVIDSGPGTFEPSTVVDLTHDEPSVLREGRGVLA